MIGYGLVTRLHISDCKWGWKVYNYMFGQKIGTHVAYHHVFMNHESYVQCSSTRQCSHTILLLQIEHLHRPIKWYIVLLTRDIRTMSVSSLLFPLFAEPIPSADCNCIYLILDTGIIGHALFLILTKFTRFDRSLEYMECVIIFLCTWLHLSHNIR